MSALQSALKALKKNKVVNLKDAVVDLGDGQEPIPCIPTGSVVLDYLIGGYRTETGEKRCPGIPKGRITEIYGPEGSGKCVTADTHVISEYGMVSIEELFLLSGYDLGDRERIEEHEVDLLNEFGEMETTSHLTWNGRKTVRKITTRGGYQLEATQNHPIRALDKEGNIVWRRAGEIEQGDYLVLMSGNVKFPSTSEATVEDAKKVASYYRNSFPIDLMALKEQRGGEVIETPEEMVEEIPLYIRQGTKDVVEAFVETYLQRNYRTCVRTGHSVIRGESEKFLRQMQMLLLSLGRMTFLRTRNVCGGTEYELGGFYAHPRNSSISAMDGVENIIPNMGKHLQTLYDSVSGDKQKLGNLLERGEGQGRGLATTRKELREIVEAYENVGDFTARSIIEYLQNILDMGYYFDSVDDIEDIADVPTYDVSLPVTHSFWSNGLISHNTTVAIHTAIQAQRAGGTVCFLDYEHAFAPTYAADIGLELDDSFLLVQPRHWEEGAEIIQTMAKAGVDLIIVDSVAAMKPQSEVENQDVSYTGQVGHIARLQSSFLPKIVNTLEESGTALIYINQLRSRIKMSMYDAGPDEESSGGRALRYYASLRMQVKRTRVEYAQVENELTGSSEKQPISNIIRAQNVKNKVSKHQGRSADFVIRYGEGIDNVRSVIDIAEARKIIKRAGAWYTFMGSDGTETKTQGKEGLRNHFIDNPDDFQALVREVSSFTRSNEKLRLDDDVAIEEEIISEDD